MTPGQAFPLLGVSPCAGTAWLHVHATQGPGHPAPPSPGPTGERCLLSPHFLHTCHKMQLSPTKKACSRDYRSSCGEMKIQDRRIPTGLDILVVSAFWALDPTCKPQSHACRMMITDWHLSIKEALQYHSLSRKKRHLSPKPRKRESFICIYLTNT